MRHGVRQAQPTGVKVGQRGSAWMLGSLLPTKPSCSGHTVLPAQSRGNLDDFRRNLTGVYVGERWRVQSTLLLPLSLVFTACMCGDTYLCVATVLGIYTEGGTRAQDLCLPGLYTDVGPK